LCYITCILLEKRSFYNNNNIEIEQKNYHYYDEKSYEKKKKTGPTRFSQRWLQRVLSGHAVAQAVSRWLHTAVARVHVWAACGFCGGQSSTGAGFL
jgi:pyruvate formate-lyase activating enzyme-like uncharacterized protein